MVAWLALRYFQRSVRQRLLAFPTWRTISFRSFRHMICRKYSISHRGGPVNTDNTRYWRQFLLLGIGMIVYTICRAAFPVGLAAMGKQFQWTAFEVGILRTIFLLRRRLIEIPAAERADSL